MPVATPEQYEKMLDAARAGKYAYPAINVTSTETANAALKGFADSGSDGIIQVSTGGGEFASGLNVKNMAEGAISIAEHVHRMAEHYPILVGLHTDHCQADKLDKLVRPLIQATAALRKAGQGNLFNSHMFDGSELPIDENMKLAVELLKECKENQIVLEVEIGVVGGEEDGMDRTGAPKAKLYTTPEDMVKVYEALHKIGGRYMVAATFGNVHGVYKPGNVVLKPKILRDGQEALKKKFGPKASFDLVFHGGSGSEIKDIHETIEYGVVKMNVDTDTQYWFTQAVLKHMIDNRGELTHTADNVANKKKYDPRSYLKEAEKSMAKRVSQACKDLKSEGRTLFGK